MSIEQAATELQQMLQQVVEQMVERPDEVRIVVGRMQDVVTFDVQVAPGDVGRVIGRNGFTARSIRTILVNAARKHQVRIELSLPRQEVFQ